MGRSSRPATWAGEDSREGRCLSVRLCPGWLNMDRPDNDSPDPREVELKLQLSPGGRAVLEASRVFATAEAKQLHLVTTYFDTPNGLLEKAGLTLRVRRSGDTRIQTVKSRANGRGVAINRSEREWQIGQDEPDVERLAE